eukprot:4589331-Amphidinium_carterae.1
MDAYAMSSSGPDGDKMGGGKACTSPSPNTEMGGGRACTSPSPTTELATGIATMELISGNVALPMVAGHIILQPPTLPQTLADILTEEGAFARADPPSTLAPSYTSVHDWHALAVEFLQRGLCCLMPEAEGVSHNGHRVSAGLFGVPKKQTSKARLIVDRRPQNCLEVSLRRVVMDRVLARAISIAE